MTPLIERHVKDAIAKTFIPVYSQQSSASHQELMREMRSELHSVKSELTAWHTELSRSHEVDRIVTLWSRLIIKQATIRDLEHTVRSLSDQVKYMTMNSSGGGIHLQQSQPSHNSPGPAVSQMQSNLGHRQPNITTGVQAASSYSKYPQQSQQQPVMHPSWFPSSIAAPQASHPATIPQPPPPPPLQPIAQDRTPPVKHDQWDEVYLNVLQSQDAGKLRDLLTHTNPEVIMPLNGPSLVSQAVILTLIHRVSCVHCIRYPS